MHKIHTHTYRHAHTHASPQEYIHKHKSITYKIYVLIIKKYVLFFLDQTLGFDL